MKTKPLTDHQMKLIESILKADPPIVVVSIKDSGLHYCIANGGTADKRDVGRLISRGVLKSNRDGFDDLTPQSYRVDMREVEQS